MVGTPVGWVWAAACAPSEPTTNDAEWAYEAPPAGSLDPLSAEMVSRALETALPQLTQLEPAAFEAPLEALSGAMSGCGQQTAEFDGQSYLFWLDTDCGDLGSISGFAYQMEGPYAAYDATGTMWSTYWSADAHTPDRGLTGVAQWGEYQFTYADGTVVDGGYFDGELGTEGALELPPGYDPTHQPTVGWTRFTDPLGSVYVGFEGAISQVDDQVDAVALYGVYVDPTCAAVSGLVSVHAIGGEWIDVELVEIDANCTACGPMPDGGEDACLNLEPILVRGGAR